MRIAKEIAGGLLMASAIVLCFWLTVFGMPQAKDEAPVRVTAGVQTALTDGWTDRLKAHEKQQAKAVEEQASKEAQARRSKAPSGVPQDIWNLCREYETKHISAYILAGVAKVESDFNPRCVTGKCFGLMQIHQTWEFDRFRNGERWDNPRASIRVCVEILEEHWQKYHSVRKALQVYNMGWKGVEYDSTSYSNKVIRYAEKYKGEHK